MNALRLAGLIAARNLRNVVRIPGNVFSVVGVPLLVLVVFSGAFDRVTSLPGFPTPSALTWITPYAVVLGATFSGLGTASNVERDRATGFLDRLFASPAGPFALIAGEVLGTIGRALIQLAVILVAAVPAGLRMPGGALALVVLVVVGAGLSACSALWSLALMHAVRGPQTIGLVSAALYAVGLLSTGQIPSSYQTGWLAATSRHNPLSPVLATARSGFLGPVTWHAAGTGLIVLAVLLAVLATGAWLAVTQARRADPGAASRTDDGPALGIDHPVPDPVDGLPAS
jgi:ABC-2 type transport system permease protein